MSEFFAAMVAWPTIVYTAMLGIVGAYWALVLIGAVGHDMDAEAHADLEGHLDLDLDADLDGDLDGDADADGEHGHGAFVQTLDSLGLTGVPITVVVSLLVLYAWATSMLMAGPVVARLAGQGMLLTAALVGVAFVALGVAVVAAAITIKPIRPLFKVTPAPRRRHFIGAVCRITTQRVDAGFGQAEIDDGQAGLVVQVRCPKDNDLAKGDSAVVYDYDSATEVYMVAPNAEVRAGKEV